MSASFGLGNQGLQVERPETPPLPTAINSFSRDLDFVNRGDILDQIDERCSEPAGRVALVGLGGVGKSQLAIEFAHRIAAGQPDTWARVEEGFRTIADAVKLSGRHQPKADIPQLVYNWLSNERNGKWIMILDSVNDPDVFYTPTGRWEEAEKLFVQVMGDSQDQARGRPPFHASKHGQVESLECASHHFRKEVVLFGDICTNNASA
ncbi:hypothetical protein N0V88_006632 [Collariella sp. IMI 366227]|nr:hypothetical protein N0V88_006632 [Collariella sp. IMI 366227]